MGGDLPHDLHCMVIFLRGLGNLLELVTVFTNPSGVVFLFVLMAAQADFSLGHLPFVRSMANGAFRV